MSDSCEQSCFQTMLMLLEKIEQAADRLESLMARTELVLQQQQAATIERHLKKLINE